MIATIRHRPVTSFLLITVAVSYVLGIPFNIAASSMLDRGRLAGTYAPRIVTVIGPAVAALVVTLAQGGAPALARLASSLRLRIGDAAWIPPLAVVAFAVAGAAFLLAGLPAATLADLVATRAPLLLAHVVIQAAVIGVGEELGWRGWLLPALSVGRSFLAATALTGLAWALWHLPIFFSGASIALSFTGLVASLAVAFSWLWYRTGGAVGLVAIAHGMVNAPFFFLEQAVRPMADGDELARRAFAYFAGLYFAVGVAVAVNGRHLWRDQNAGSRRVR